MQDANSLERLDSSTSVIDQLVPLNNPIALNSKDNSTRHWQGSESGDIMVEAERRCVCAVLGNSGDDQEDGMTS